MNPPPPLTAAGAALWQSLEADPRWNKTDELLFQVAGFALYGYVFGVGRLLHLLDVADINAVVVQLLEQAGTGPTYAQGLVAAAQATFEQPDDSLTAQLVGVGYAQFAAPDPFALVETVYTNAALLRNSQQ